VQSTAAKPSLNLSQDLKDGGKVSEPPAVDALFDAAQSPNGHKPRKPSRTTERQALADEVLNPWWERNKAGWAQSYIAVRNIVRTAVVNGLEPEIVAKCLDHLAATSIPVSGGSIQNALRDLGLLGRRNQRGGASDDLANEDYERTIL
jgi:hypothetical protein